MLELEAVQPLELAGAAQFGSGGLGHRQEIVAVTATRCQPFVVAAVRKLFRGVLANGLEEPVARHFGCEVRFDETLVDERADDAEHIVQLNRDSVCGDCFGGIERPASREHGEPRDTSRSRSVSNSCDQSTIARSVCWRGGASRPP